MATRSFVWSGNGIPWHIVYDVTGEGGDALLLPALSSVSTREEMQPLAGLLQARHRCILPDWPGFGAAPGADHRLTPKALVDFLRAFVGRLVRHPALVVVAGHSAAYVMTVARDPPDAARSCLAEWRSSSEALSERQCRDRSLIYRGLAKSDLDLAACSQDYHRAYSVFWPSDVDETASRAR